MNPEKVQRYRSKISRYSRVYEILTRACGLSVRTSAEEMFGRTAERSRSSFVASLLIFTASTANEWSIGWNRIVSSAIGQTLSACVDRFEGQAQQEENREESNSGFHSSEIDSKFVEKVFVCLFVIEMIV